MRAQSRSLTTQLQQIVLLVLLGLLVIPPVLTAQSTAQGMLQGRPLPCLSRMMRNWVSKSHGVHTVFASGFGAVELGAGNLSAGETNGTEGRAGWDHGDVVSCWSVPLLTASHFFRY